MPPPEGHAADDWDAHWGSYESAARSNPAVAYRKRLILSALGGSSPRAQIVDIGSGLGELAVSIATAFPEAEIRGLEYSAAGVEFSRATAAGAGIGARLSFSQKDLLGPLDLDESERHWATVAICSEVLEHVDSPEVLLGHAAEYLAPGCRVIVTVPGGPRTAFDKHIGHRKHFTEQTLRSVLDASGFDVLEVRRGGSPSSTSTNWWCSCEARRSSTSSMKAVRRHRRGLASTMLRFFDRDIPLEPVVQPVRLATGGGGEPEGNALTEVWSDPEQGLVVRLLALAQTQLGGRLLRYSAVSIIALTLSEALLVSFNGGLGWGAAKARHGCDSAGDGSGVLPDPAMGLGPQRPKPLPEGGPSVLGRRRRRLGVRDGDGAICRGPHERGTPARGSERRHCRRRVHFRLRSAVGREVRVVQQGAFRRTRTRRP